MINRGRRKNLIPEGVDVIVADKKDTKRIQSILKNRIFDAVMDFLCYSDKDTADSFKFYSQYTKQYFFISSCAVYNTSLGGILKKILQKFYLCGIIASISGLVKKVSGTGYWHRCKIYDHTSMCDIW